MGAQTVNGPVVVGGKPSYVQQVDCQRCGRFGLPLLVLVPSVVDSRHAKALADAGYSWTAGLDAEFDKVKRQSTLPVARMPGHGFVMVLYGDRGRWDIWQSYQDGTFKKLLENVSPVEYEKYGPIFKPETSGSVCQRGAANLPAGLIALNGPHTQSDIWLAFSRHLWAPSIVADMTTDASGARARVMRKLAAKAWIRSGKAPGNGFLPLNEANLSAHVPEFSNLVPPAGPQFNPLTTAFADAWVPIETARFGKARDMDAKVRAVEKTAGPKALNKALIVCLRDGIGVAGEHNQLRNAEMERLTLFQQKHQREKAISDVIGGVKKMVEAEAKKDAEKRFKEVEERREQFDKDHPYEPRVIYAADGHAYTTAPPAQQALVGVRRQKYVDDQVRWKWSQYAHYIREKEWTDFDNMYKPKFDQHKKLIDSLADDHTAALALDDYQQAMIHTFDGGRKEDQKPYEAAVALSVHGMAATTVGHQWVQKQLEKDINDKLALIWRSLFGNATTVIAAVAAAAKSPKWDKVYSAMKKALTWPDLGKDTTAARMAGGWERVLITVAGPLSKMLSDANVSRSLQVMFEGLVWTRAGAMVVYEQFKLKNGMRSLAHFFEYAAWHAVDLTIDLEGTRRVGVDASTKAAKEVLPKIVATPSGMATYLMIAPEVEEDAQKLIRQFGQVRESTMEKSAQTFASIKQGFTMDARLNCIALVFELVNYFKATDKLHKADQFGQSEATGAVIAAVLGGLNAASDISAAWVKGCYQDDWKQQLSLRSQKVWGATKTFGGICGGIASFVGAYWAFAGYADKKHENEIAMSWLYFGAGISGTVSGLSTIVSGVTSGLEGFGAISATTSATVRAGSAFVGVRAGLIGVVVALIIMSFEDEPLAKWLERTVWGRRTTGRYGNLPEEMHELEKLVKVKSP